MLDERSKDASSNNEVLRPDVDNIILRVLFDGSLLNVLCAMALPDVCLTKVMTRADPSPR